MKRCLPFLLLFCTLTTCAQTVLQTSDSLIHITAQWCKGDTMCYQYEQAQFRINRHDTLCTDYSCQELSFVVCDSTERGFVLEYLPTLKEAKMPSDTTQQAIRAHIIDQLHQQRVRLQTDRLGAVQHIDNWRELRDALQASVTQTLDETYAAGAANLIPRNRMEALLRMEFATEENLRNSIEELDLLFGFHGFTAPIGQQTVKETKDFPTEGNITASYGPYGAHGFDRDYSLLIQTHTQVPAEEAKGIADQLMDIVMADNLIGRVNHLLDKGNDDLWLTNTEEYHYFFNGWPCMILRQQTIRYGKDQNLKMKRVEWTRRTWAEQPAGNHKGKDM